MQATDSNFKLRFPIGKYEAQPFSVGQKIEWLADIKFLPLLLESAVFELSDEQLDTPYREGGWTLKQVVHHIADSHMNAYIRFKLALTEDNPVIKPYEEKLWAGMNDVKKLPVDVSLTLLHSLHARWYEAIKLVSDDDWQNRTLYHPASKISMTLWFLLGMYAWHGKHHAAQITSLRERKGW